MIKWYVIFVCIAASTILSCILQLCVCGVCFGFWVIVKINLGVWVLSIWFFSRCWFELFFRGCRSIVKVIWHIIWSTLQEADLVVSSIFSSDYEFFFCFIFRGHMLTLDVVVVFRFSDHNVSVVLCYWYLCTVWISV